MSAPPSLWLVRHGESEANRAGTFDGYADAALTELGHHQARLVAAQLAALELPFVRLICSPLRRALATAEPIGAALGVLPRVDARLRAGEGRSNTTTFEQAGEEVRAAIEAACSQWNGPLIAVTHRYPIRGYLGYLYGAEHADRLMAALGNGDVLEIKFCGDSVGSPLHRPATGARSG